MARRVFDSNSFGKLKLIGALLDRWSCRRGAAGGAAHGRPDAAATCGCTHNDTEGLINLPLTAREIQAVVFFKVHRTGDVRVSMRSKYDVDVRRVASGLRRRRPQERGRLHVSTARSRASAARPRRPPRRRHRRGLLSRPVGRGWVANRPYTTEAMHGVLVIDKPAGPDLARRRRAGAAGARREAHRPHGDARSDGDRRAAARHRPRDAAGVDAERRREDLRGGRPASDAPPTRTMRRAACGRSGRAGGAGYPARGVDREIDRGRARPFRGRSSRRLLPTRRRRSAASRRTSSARQQGTCAPSPVGDPELDRWAYQAGSLTLRVTATAGFYVRSLAHDLGTALGCGAHLGACGGRGPARSPGDAVPLESSSERSDAARPG
jgi:hypothetical protein